MLIYYLVFISLSKILQDALQNKKKETNMINGVFSEKHSHYNVEIKQCSDFKIPLCLTQPDLERSLSQEKNEVMKIEVMLDSQITEKNDIKIEDNISNINSFNYYFSDSVNKNMFVYPIYNDTFYCPENSKLYMFKDSSNPYLKNFSNYTYINFLERKDLNKIIILLTNEFDSLKINGYKTLLYAMVFFTEFSDKIFTFVKDININSEGQKIINDITSYVNLIASFNYFIEKMKIFNIENLKKILNDHRRSLFYHNEIFNKKINENNINETNKMYFSSLFEEFDNIRIKILFPNFNYKKIDPYTEIEKLPIFKIELKFLLFAINTITTKFFRNTFLNEFSKSKAICDIINLEYIEFRLFIKRLILRCLFIASNDAPKTWILAKIVFVESLLLKKMLVSHNTNSKILFVCLSEIINLLVFADIYENNLVVNQISVFIIKSYIKYEKDISVDQIIEMIFKIIIKYRGNYILELFRLKTIYFLTNPRKINDCDSDEQFSMIKDPQILSFLVKFTSLQILYYENLFSHFYKKMC